MKYYLTSVVFALLMGAVCVVLQPHPFPQAGFAVTGLFSAHDAQEAETAQEEAMPA
ncbi:hypothetical protein [uncultured Massilia sp.]|uniref:hypothetical protein n=1 Tax=uncultured Massilia sp. TaxID=169973 RepID=UPI0025D8C138|nr:hypothetical protein [uncultured Massilia sp.]